jgi:nanoRNase/pAp phosphatase (c-di-AMP/oligoRNAs hydrolase)
MQDEANPSKAKTISRKRSRKDALKDLLSHFHSKDHVLITIDPDPDAIGSALAVKRLLWHRVQSTTIGIIRPIRRLNNLTLARLLKLPLVLLNKSDLPHHDRCIVVDGQPHHNDFFKEFTYTAVIDHHPLSTPVEAPFVDIRPHYGATSTILSEYLKAAAIKPSQTLATAMLYGIKTDTRSFERHTIVEDIEAFRGLFTSANHNVLRKVEISDLSLKELKFFHKAVERKHVVRDRVFVHLDEVTSADILVELAEFFLKIHDISWSIVSGIYEENLIIVVRNDGYRKDAGKIVRKAFGGIGCAGGHRAMARAEIHMERVVHAVGKRSSGAIERFIRKRMSPGG